MDYFTPNLRKFSLFIDLKMKSGARKSTQSYKHYCRDVRDCTSSETNGVFSAGTKAQLFKYLSAPQAMPRKNKKATVEPVETNAPTTPGATTATQSSNPTLHKGKLHAGTKHPSRGFDRRRGGEATIESTYLSLEESSFIPISVRKEIQTT